MDTSRQVSDVITSKSELLGGAQRQRRSIAEKRRIVEETLVEGDLPQFGQFGQALPFFSHRSFSLRRKSPVLSILGNT
jgi:hypothetical protein